MRSVLHLKVALARQRCRQGRALVLCSVTMEGVMRGIAVLENHADRNACIDKDDRRETSGDVCVCMCARMCLYWKSMCVNVCREVCEGWIHNVRCVFVLRHVCVYNYAENYAWTHVSMHGVCVCVCVCEGVRVSDSNMSVCVPGWRLCDLSSLWSSEHRHSDETKHAHAEQLSHRAESQLVTPVPSIFPL